MHKILLVEVITLSVTGQQLLEQWGYEVVAVEDLWMSSGSLSETDPQFDPYGYWPSTLQWVPLVPGDSQGFKGSDHVSFFTGSKPWILSWPSIWGRRLTSLLTKMCSLPRFKGLLRRSYEFGTDQKSAGAP